MAYQVAQAYDEDKNLVPLYILTDGEVPEVSPGFDVVTSGNADTEFTTVITANSSNPTGGSVTSSGSVQVRLGDDHEITVYNNTVFGLRLIISFSSTGTYTAVLDTQMPIMMAPNASMVVQFHGHSTGLATTVTFTVTVSIERVATA